MRISLFIPGIDPDKQSYPMDAGFQMIVTTVLQLRLNYEPHTVTVPVFQTNSDFGNTT